MGLKEDLKIDKYSLDEEWLKQPSLYLEWAEQVVEAQSNRDRKKEQLDVVKAELDIDIRSNPEKYGISKITEGAIQNIILTEGSCRDANDNYLKSVETVRMLEIARESLEHKKKALESLTQLYLNGYYLTDGVGIKGDVKQFIDNSKQIKMRENLNNSDRLQRLKKKKEEK